MNLADQVERLSSLRDRGVITDEEFAALKAKLIQETPSEMSPITKNEGTAINSEIGATTISEKGRNHISDRIASIITTCGFVVAVIHFCIVYPFTDMGMFFSLMASGIMFIGFAVLAGAISFLGFLFRVEQKVDDWASK